MLNFLKYSFACLLMSCTLSQANADGELMVMPARSTIEGTNTKVIEVSNLGDKPLYLTTVLMRIENPGENPEVKVRISEIADPKMIATPSKLTLGPGQKKSINVVSLKETTIENLYRLYIVPVSNIKINEKSNMKNISAPVTFGIGYGVLIHHVPTIKNQVKEWGYACMQSSIQFIAKGNLLMHFTKLSTTDKHLLPTDIKVFPGHPRTFPVKNAEGIVSGHKFNISCN